MNIKRVEKELRKVAKKYRVSARVQKAILKDLREDDFFSGLPADSEIEFVVDTEKEVEPSEQDICLFIGKRDWQWDLKTGELVGSGMLLL